MRTVSVAVRRKESRPMDNPSGTPKEQVCEGCQNHWPLYPDTRGRWYHDRPYGDEPPYLQLCPYPPTIAPSDSGTPSDTERKARAFDFVAAHRGEICGQGKLWYLNYLDAEGNLETDEGLTPLEAVEAAMKQEPTK